MCYTERFACVGEGVSAQGQEDKFSSYLNSDQSSTPSLSLAQFPVANRHFSTISYYAYARGTWVVVREAPDFLSDWASRWASDWASE